MRAEYRYLRNLLTVNGGRRIRAWGENGHMEWILPHTPRPIHNVDMVTYTIYGNVQGVVR